MQACRRHRTEIDRLLEAAPATALGQALRARPRMVGIVHWPYQCAAWDVAERVERLASHFRCVEALPALQFAMDDKLLLADLGEISADTRVILDQPAWLAREGLLALNLFKGDFRAFSISFSLHEAPEGRTLFIGGLQGRNVEGAMDLYRQWTKDFQGLRPRDLLLDLLRMVATELGASRIEAVADANRYFRHAYFGGTHPGAMNIDYDEIWLDRGGERVGETHYLLPVETVRRDLAEVKPNKRSLYRKRYAMLDELQDVIAAGMRERAVVRFDAG